jgi:phospholipid transport system transporter-binding protein
MTDKENLSETDTNEEMADASTSESLLENGPCEDLSTDNPLTSLKSEWIKVSLEPSLTLVQLIDLKEKLLEYQGARVQLDGIRVERVDTAALQLLFAFVNSPAITVGWVEASTELLTAARLLGLSSLMGLPLNNAQDNE